MAKNPGQIVKFEDGRVGIIYAKKQFTPKLYTIHLVDPETYKQLFDDKGKPKIVYKGTTTGLTLLGHVD